MDRHLEEEIYGKDTKNAVTDFQMVTGLTANGKLNASTLHQIVNVYGQYDKYMDILENDGEYRSGYTTTIEKKLAELVAPYRKKGTGKAVEMKVSDSLIDFLSDYEEFKPKPYYATKEEKKKGIKTVGFGHVIQPGENFNDRITLDQAKKLLKKDLSSREETVRNLTKGVTINQQQFDALVDFQFNTGNLASSDLLKHFRSGNVTDDQLLKDFLGLTRQGSNHLINLYQRRYDEWEIFTNGEYKRNEKRKAPAGYI